MLIFSAEFLNQLSNRREWCCIWANYTVPLHFRNARHHASDILTLWEEKLSALKPVFSVHLLCIQLVTKHYTVVFLSNLITNVLRRPEYNRTFSLEQAMLASSILIDHTWTLHGGPVRWWFFRTNTLLRDFTAKPTHSPAVFTLWVGIPIRLPLSHPFCSYWTNLPRTLLEVASQIVWHIHAKD